MTDDQEQRPLANLLAAVGGGQATVALSPEEFVYIERDCESFKRTIRKIQSTINSVADHPEWGLGENHGQLVSAATVVGRFREKANRAPDGNSVYEIMEQHYKIVEDIQEVHRQVRRRMMDADAEFAAEFDRLSATLPQRPPEGTEFGPYLLPDGSVK